MKLRASILWLATFALFSTSAFAQTDWSKVTMKVTHISKTIYMIEGMGGNIGVSAGPDGILIVDDQFAPLAEKIEAALREINPGKLKYLLNTHHHGDHTGSNPHFGALVPIIAQQNVRKHLMGPDSKTGPGLPVITFDDKLSVHFNGEEIKLTHLPPAHTDGDTMIHFTGANVIHMGDTFFSGRFPNIDLGGGGDVRGYIRNIEDTLKKLPEGVKLIPGHGPLSTIEEMKIFHNMLVETSAVVQKAIDEGKTLDQAKAAGLPEVWKKWEAPTLGTARWIEIVYQGLKRKPL